MPPFLKQLMQWAPTVTTVIGLGLVIGGLTYYFTGSLELAMMLAGGFKVICPQDSAVTDQVLTALNDVTKVIPIRKTGAVFAAMALGTGLALSACQQLAAFEKQAAPVIAQGCVDFHAAEADPLVQSAIAGGVLAASAATGGIAGPVVASLKGFGDAFCQAGPPAGDVTTPAQQAQWLAGVTQQLLSAAGVKQP